MHSASATLNARLTGAPPPLLWHYTSAEGLIGILRNKEVWATNLAFLNDAKEVKHAVDVTQLCITNLLATGRHKREHVDVLAAMHDWSGAAGKRTYVFSLSEQRDLLSQWRAYCPPAGGYSIGLPALRLRALATAQGFFLGPCIYDLQTQHQITSEFVDAYLARYDELCASGQPEAEVRRRIAWELGQHLVVFGALLKHHSFREEQEWRLVAGHVDERHAQIDFRASSRGVVPFFRFRLTTAEYPNIAEADGNSLTVVAGPCVDHEAAALAIQFAMTSFLGTSTHGGSEIPFRAP